MRGDPGSSREVRCGEPAEVYWVALDFMRYGSDPDGDHPRKYTRCELHRPRLGVFTDRDAAQACCDG